MTTPFSVIIPARYASSRLPAKPLCQIGAWPMIRWVYQRACQSGAERVVIATDDQRIAEVCRAFGGEVCMTHRDHASGSDRLAEVVSQLNLADETIVVNLQGDEPMMPPLLLQQVAQGLASHPTAMVATLATPIDSAEDLFNPNIVKVVVDQRGYALYFSRAVIPWHRDGFAVTTATLPLPRVWQRHLGLYAYRAAFLRQLPQLPRCDLEAIEALEQLRILYHGYTIHVATACENPGHGVDTAADLERVRQLLAGSGA
jgi:3-deoxy-manno-octulosonate cytidylyltransferase (CMP-KDO synthetase)